MDLKKPLTFDEQIEKLISHGMVISDKEKAKKILSQINYYRFTGYTLQYRKSPNKSEYIDGLRFETVYRIYQFDESLRDIFRKHIERIEVYYRTQISYGFSIKKCKTSPYDQHYYESNFYNKQGYNKIMSDFNRERDYYKDSLIVKHHRDKYADKMPLWVIVELMSFSNTSKLFSSMYISEKLFISNTIGVSPKTLENHLHCLSVLRNKCAHAARLYNTELNPPVRFTSEFLQKHPEIKNNSLLAYIIVLIKRLPEKSIKKSFYNDLSAVIEEYKDDINLSLIGFTRNSLEYLHRIIF